MVSQVGTVAGIQVMLTVQAAALHGRSGQDALLSSFHAAFAVGGAVAVLAVFGAAMSRSTNRRRGPAVELSEALDMGERVPVPVVDSEEEGEHDPAPVDPAPEGRTLRDSAPVDPTQTGREAGDRAASLPWENA
jgi:hypothetical protein